jgi:hypothetical protein
MIVPAKLDWLFNLVPQWFRTRFPLKAFYWQKEEIEEMKRLGKEMAKTFGLEK